MPPSIRNQSKEVRCPKCDKLLATAQGIKCPKCKEIHTHEQCFAEELKPDDYYVVGLWLPDGTQASSIIIRKEIRLSIGELSRVPKDRLRYPVFFVYNHFDSSKAYAQGVGCQVNKEPILDFAEALKIAKIHEVEARRSGKWVDVEKLEPRIHKLAS